MMIYGIVYDKKTAPHMGLMRGTVQMNQTLHLLGDYSPQYPLSS